MDLRLFAQAVGRHKLIATLGVMVAFAVAFISYVHVDPFGSPVFRYRTQVIWTSKIKLQVQAPGFVEGSVNSTEGQADPIALAPLYAQLANSDSVREIMKSYGPIFGGVTINSLVDSNRASLPVIEIASFARNAQRAKIRASNQARAFTQYIERRQAANKIPPKRRIGLQVIKGPTDPFVALPRKKTLPIVVLVAFLVMVAALIATVDNLTTRRAPRVAVPSDDIAVDPDEQEPVPIRATQEVPVRAKPEVAVRSAPEVAVLPSSESATRGAAQERRSARWTVRSPQEASDGNGAQSDPKGSVDGSGLRRGRAR
jgi:hypothetical protein